MKEVSTILIIIFHWGMSNNIFGKAWQFHPVQNFGIALYTNNFKNLNT